MGTATAAFIPTGPMPTGPASIRAAQRIAISPRTHARFKTHVAKRFRGSGSLSRLGTIVLDTYLSHMERAYFGRCRATSCASTAASSRGMDAVIFDMDGVLCDSEQASRQAAVALFRTAYDTRVDARDFAPFTGMGEARFLQGVAEKYGVAGFDAEEAKRAFFDTYIGSGYAAEVRAFPGIKGLVGRVKALGMKVAVASAADRVKVEANLKAIGFDESTFDFVTSSDDIERKKPAPDVFLAAAQGVAVDAHRCVVVEDAVAGVVAARAAGMRCVAVCTSLNAHLLSEAGAHVVRDVPAMIHIADLLGHQLEDGQKEHEQHA